MNKIPLKDNETCPECSHLGRYHYRASARPNEGGGCYHPIKSPETIYEKRCICKSHRREE